MDVKATGLDGSVSLHDDQSKEHPLECGLHVASEICFQP